MKEIKKILVIDDDVDIVEQLQIILANKGYNVISASSAEEGWKIFEQIKPDAVILDLMMEEHDSGFILSYKMRKTEWGSKTPIIIMTSAAHITNYKFSAATEEEKEWLKCDAILNKPLLAEDLLNTLESVSIKY